MTTPVAPGISHLLNLYPDSGKVLRDLTHQLLVKPSPLSRLEREIIASRVSMFNNCEFCHESHKHIALALCPGIESPSKVMELCTHPSLLPHSTRLFHLDVVARYTQSNGDKFHGAIATALQDKHLTPHEVHDCVLVSAAFCMYNRYVSCLNPTPATPSQYRESALHIAQHGYSK